MGEHLPVKSCSPDLLQDLWHTPEIGSQVRIQIPREFLTYQYRQDFGWLVSVSLHQMQAAGIVVN
jgi:hypothetical protein